MKVNATFQCTAAVLTALLCGSVLASPPADPTKTVNYEDLNLRTTAGVNALYQRIEKAANEVCQLPKGTQQLKLESELKACKADATDRAVMQANLQALTSLHLARTGRQVDPGRYADRR